MNVTGLKTLLSKEVRRFMRVPGQTVLSPLISTTLYFVVFAYSLGQRVEVRGVPYSVFIVPGLIFLGVANNAFLNSSSSLFIMRIQGTLVDLLVAPMGAVELLTGFVGGAMIRGLAVGLLTWAVALLFTPVTLVHGTVLFVFLFLNAFVFSLLGFLAGLWSEKFEHVNFFPTFVMLPLTFLGGIFYSVDELPQPWRTISHVNPMVYMVEGMRYGMIGESPFSPLLGFGMLLALGLGSVALALTLVQRGYKLKQ